MRIQNEAVSAARQAIASILAYKHDVTGRGIRSEPMLKLIRLDRALRTAAEDLDALRKELIQRLGTERVAGQPATASVAKGSPEQALFFEEWREVMATEMEVDDKLMVTLKDLQVRNESGELEDQDNGLIAYLGPLLVTEVAVAKAAEKVTPIMRGRRKQRSAE